MRKAGNRKDRCRRKKAKNAPEKRRGQEGIQVITEEKRQVVQVRGAGHIQYG